jgi:hypothetical protein
VCVCVCARARVCVCARVYLAFKDHFLLKRKLQNEQNKMSCIIARIPRTIHIW